MSAPLRPRPAAPHGPAVLGRASATPSPPVCSPSVSLAPAGSAPCWAPHSPPPGTGWSPSPAAPAPAAPALALLLPEVPRRPAAAVAHAAADLLLIAVPDDALAGVVADLAEQGALRPGQIVAHTSGAHGLAVLEPAAAAGARPLALHPAMTFTGTPDDLDPAGRHLVRGDRPGGAAPAGRPAGRRPRWRARVGGRVGPPALPRRAGPRREPPGDPGQRGDRPAARRRGGPAGEGARPAAAGRPGERAAARRRRADRPGLPRRRGHRCSGTWPGWPPPHRSPSPRTWRWPDVPPTGRSPPAGCGRWTRSRCSACWPTAVGRWPREREE